MPEPPMISVRNLAKRYGGVVALDDMNLTVEQGTIHAVVSLKPRWQIDADEGARRRGRARQRRHRTRQARR